MKNHITNESLIKLSIAITLILFAVFSRLMPHPANFAPIAAVAIFGGTILPRKWAAFLPLTALIISDLIIGLHPLIMFTWGSFVIIALASGWLLKKISPIGVTLASLGASSFFFVTTNFGVWLEGRLYPQNVTGLIDCFYNALPFFRNTLIGDLVFSALLFGIYAALTKLSINKQPVSALSADNRM